MSQFKRLIYLFRKLEILKENEKFG